MKNPIKDNLNFALKIFRLKRELNPDKAFLRAARARFLASLTPQKTYVHRQVLRWGYVVAVIAIALGGTGGLAAFADIQNVPATSPLYELKRVSENTRVALAPAQDKPAVHAQLAQRRLQEIEQSQPAKTFSALSPVASSSEPAATPSAMVKKLDDDLRNELNQAIGTAEPSPASSSAPENLNEEDNTASASAQTAQKESSDTQDRTDRVCKLAAEALKKHFLQPRRDNFIENRCDLSNR